ncbi:MAG: Arc family DNA-binding protein [Cyclobacteriaceae bacterium]
MANLTIKNIPKELYEMLKIQAKSNHRSINSEVIVTLKEILGMRERPGVEEVIRQAREFRSRITVTLSEGEINEAKRFGRG